MSVTAKIYKPQSGGVWLEIDNSVSLEHFEVLVGNRELKALRNEDFLIRLIECIDEAYRTIGLESPFGKLERELDEQRMQAVQDVTALVEVIRSGCIVVEPKIDPHVDEVNRILARWRIPDGTMWRQPKEEPNEAH